METILCYGDSNTWGWDPRGYLGGRYDLPWPALLGEALGCKTLNLGACGRTLPGSPGEYRALEQALKAHRPVGLLVLMLGTNDLLEGREVREPLRRLLAFLKAREPGLPLLVLVPPAIGLPQFRQASLALPDICRQEADFLCDTQRWDLPLCFDGIHLTEEGHRIFARNLADFLRDHKEEWT